MKYLFLIVTLAVVFAVVTVAAFTKFKLEDENYDRLKWLALKWHYITAFLAAIVKVGSFPYGIETVAIVAAIGALMCGLLGVSAKNYYVPVEMDVEGLKYIEDEEDYEWVEEPEEETENEEAEDGENIEEAEKGEDDE